ncbi:MAG: ribosome small subunit-dependent GTPase A [Eggerthellaceae bacterium]|nr:ribosome small subunit-dependent GTPase A [Eggerthellaceae bacterium]
MRVVSQHFSSSSERGIVVQLDRGFPLVRLDDGRMVRCKHATALVKGEKIRAVIGDKVSVDVSDNADVAQIAEILPRSNEFLRRDPAERSQAQVLAANFDTVIVAHPLAELNVRRLERELVLAHETGARVVVALTKADLASDDQAAQNEDLARRIVGESGAVEVVSEAVPPSIELLRSHVPAETIAVLIGRSGVGKSSLVNLLAGAQVQATTPVREADGKGRHTTVNRAIVPIGGGGFVVDMPGVRGMGLWESDAGIEAAFADVVARAAECKFRDCTHADEPGCAVRAAVEAGTLHSERLASYQRLVKENDDQHAAAEEAQRIRGRTGHPRRRA